MSIDFEIPAEAKAIREKVRKWVQDECIPAERELDTKPLAEVLGPQYVERDKFARVMKYRGDWDAEFRKYHPDGPVIFSAFAEGVNAAIRLAIEQKRVPVEFELSGFQDRKSVV